MKKGSVLTTRRGMVALTLSAGLGLTGLHGVADTWRTSIDSALGTSSTEQTDDVEFSSDYETSDELVAAHEDLGHRIGQESTVLMKNDGVLPLATGARVTLLGMGSMYPFLGGEMGSTITTDAAVDLVSALGQAGFEVNPTMTSIYETLGAIGTEAESAMPWMGPSMNYTYRPAGFSTPYVPSEPSPDIYTTEGGADANYADSFAEYNDAATSPLGLSANERAVLQLAEDNFDTVIVLINSGSTMEVDELKHDDRVNAMLYIGFPGAYGTLGIADVLNGTMSPSGHLVDTYAVDVTSAPAVMNFGEIRLRDTSMLVWPDTLMTGLDTTTSGSSFGGQPSTASDAYLVEAEGIYTGYKYYETRYYDAVAGQGNATGPAGASGGAGSWDYDSEVSYPFGYGLSYTTFSETIDAVNVDMGGHTVTVDVTVTNTGDVAGKHVAQLYVGVPYTDYDREHGIEKAAVSLVGIEKTDELQPGDDAQLTITVDLKYIGSWDSSAKDGRGGFILDGGDYYFVLGSDAHDATNNLLAAQGIGSEGDAALASVQTIGTEGTVDEDTLALSANGTEVVNQLADADVNYYQPGYMTQLSRSDWQGTYPRTYDDLQIGGEHEEEWVKNLMDEIYEIEANGETPDPDGSGGTLTLADMAGNDNPDDPQWAQLVEQIPVGELIAKIAKGGSQSDAIPEIQNPVVYQNDGPNGFGTTISGRGLHTDDPNANYNMGTLCSMCTFAGTFNKSLATEWGHLLGNDGLWSGNYLIWASAANLHRCAFNGRNFEYYSEDPMLSNFFATETVRGALEYGIIVGPKHFAFNDQETVRAGVAPYMTEQRAREGELRAFQGSVEEAGALGMMTSFGRIRATPVNGSWGLLRNILRDEWGFRGLLSTDMNSNPGYFRAEMCIYAGVTMIADFSTDETMEDVQESWPYLTEDLVVSDSQLVAYARQNMAYQLYAFAQSAAQNVKTVRVTPWWEAALNGATYGAFGLAALFGVLYAAGAVKEAKAEKAVASGKEEN